MKKLVFGFGIFFGLLSFTTSVHATMTCAELTQLAKDFFSPGFDEAEHRRYFNAPPGMPPTQHALIHQLRGQQLRLATNRERCGALFRPDVHAAHAREAIRQQICTNLSDIDRLAGCFAAGIPLHAMGTDDIAVRTRLAAGGPGTAVQVSRILHQSSFRSALDGPLHVFEQPLNFMQQRNELRVSMSRAFNVVNDPAGCMPPGTGPGGAAVSGAGAAAPRRLRVVRDPGTTSSTAISEAAAASAGLVNAPALLPVPSPAAGASAAEGIGAEALAR